MEEPAYWTGHCPTVPGSQPAGDDDENVGCDIDLTFVTLSEHLSGDLFVFVPFVAVGGDLLVYECTHGGTESHVRFIVVSGGCAAVPRGVSVRNLFE